MVGITRGNGTHVLHQQLVTLQYHGGTRLVGGLGLLDHLSGNLLDLGLIDTGFDGFFNRLRSGLDGLLDRLLGAFTFDRFFSRLYSPRQSHSRGCWNFGGKGTEARNQLT